MKLTQMAGIIEQRVCLYGPPKSGKTRLAAMLAEHYKLLVFDLENGSITMSQVPKEWHDNIEIIKIRDSKEYPIAVETMMKVMKGNECKICMAHSKVSCPICIKNQAPLERVCLNELGLDTIVVIDSGSQFAQSAIAHITKNQSDDYKLQLDDWGNLKLIVEKFLSQIQVARYHVVFITHEEEVEFEDGKTRIVPVSGSSKSSRNTAKYFDHVVYCNISNKKHTAGSATDYNVRALAGSRTNVRLEDNKLGADLLDIFTNWKLENYGMNRASTEVSATEVINKLDAAIPKSANSGADVSEMSPAQRALYNLKNRTQ